MLSINSFISKYFLLSLFSPLFVLGLVIFNIKNYIPWDQIQKIWDPNVGPLPYLTHVHFTRLLVSSPGLYLDELYPSLGYSLFIIFFIFIISVIFVSLNKILYDKPPPFISLFLLTILFLFMNGRGIISWVAWLNIFRVNLLVQIVPEKVNKYKLLLVVLFSLLLASVSSGVFVTCSLFIVFSFFPFVVSKLNQFFASLRVRITRNSLLFVFLAFAFSIPVLSLFWRFLDKVISFYGGGFYSIIGLISHGLFGILPSIDFPIIVVTLFFFAVIVFVTINYLRLPYLVSLSILLPVFGSAFGFTILTLSIPIFLIVLPSKFSGKSLPI